MPAPPKPSLSISQVLNLRRPLVFQILRFGLVGILNTLIGLSCIYLVIYFFNADAGIANAVGYAIGLLVSFLLNRMWTFNDNKRIAAVLPKFLLVAVISYLLNLAAVVIGNRHFGINPYVVQLLGMMVYTPIMFAGCRIFVFNSTANESTFPPHSTGP